MFTGLVEEVGIVESLKPMGGGVELVIGATKIMDDMKIDDSIAVQGVCLTVIRRNESSFTVQAVEETLKKTSLGLLKQDSRVNLERALLPTSRLGGHFVQGHVDCSGTVISVKNLSASWEIWISFPEQFAKYLIHAGSICVNGISLTVADIKKNSFMVAVIPHTWQQTTISDAKESSFVNIEFDMLGKYVDRIINSSVST
jgi:riboflavin synthase